MTSIVEVGEMSPAMARQLTDRIKVAIEGVWQLITVAYVDRAWTALGYASWDEYCTREFGTSRIRLPREERQEVVASLREHGLSIRAIAAATGESKDTVARSLAAGVSNETPGSPVTGTDGKQYAAQRLREAEPEREADDIDAEAAAICAEVDPRDIDAAVTEAVESRRTPVAVPKPTVAPGVPPHPATYPAAVMELFAELIELHADGCKVLDPFAGIGTIHELRPWCTTTGIEIEREWAQAHGDTICGDSRLVLPTFSAASFDVVATSPAYGNRLADPHYDAFDAHARRSYGIDLGRPLTEGSGAALHFDTDGRYEQLHEAIWQECVRVLRPGGVLILNCKDFQRDGKIVPVTSWHIETLLELGLSFIELRTLAVGGLAQTTAAKLSELVVAFRKGGAS